MKKIIIGVFAIVMVTLLISSCEDDVPSTKHIWTESEIDRLDSILLARTGIDADKVITISVDLPADSVDYRFVEVEFDVAELMDALSYSSAEDLTAGFGTVAGGVQTEHEVTFFAVNGSTGFDNTEAFTAAGTGHWFDKNGDVISWGDNAYMFSEFDPTALLFRIGQFPNRAVPGETIRLIQMMSRDDYRVAFAFDITFGAYYVEEVPEIQIVETVPLSLDVLPNNSYAATDLSFDFNAAASTLGVDSTTLAGDQALYGINSDGSMTSSFTADPNGFWFTSGGDVTNWGEEGVMLFVTYDNGVFHVGQFPEAAVVGETYTVKMGVLYNATLEMVAYEIAVTIDGYVDPETPPAGDPEIVEKSYEAFHTYASDWSSSSTVDVKEDLRQAFKMTTYQIGQAIASGELKFYGLNADGSVYTNAEMDSVSTAAHPGHWYDLNGNVTVWGDEDNVPAVYSELKHTEETLTFAIGHHPDNTQATDEVVIKQVAELNGGRMTFTFNVKIE